MDTGFARSRDAAGSALARAHQVYLERPDDPALVVDGRDVLTYRELHERSQGIADDLRGRGLEPGDRVLLSFAATEWASFLPVWLGVVRAGLVAVSVSTRFAERELARVVQDARPALGIVSPSGPRPVSTSVPLVATSDVYAAPARTADALVVEESALAAILYTSGTTGTTKGVACPHGSLVAASFPEPRRSIHAFPFDAAAGQNVFVRALLGSPTHALSTFAPGRFVDLVAGHDIEWAGIVPTMGTMLVRSGVLHHRALPSLRVLCLAGAPSPPVLLDRLQRELPDAQIVNHYTLTEAGPMFLAQVYEPSRPTAVGPTSGDVEVRVLDEGGREASRGDVGEIALRARWPTVARCYFGDEEATARTFSPDGWLRTGDLGFVDEDGFLHLVDRKKDLIIRAGRNISCLEVEAVIAEHPDVADVAVFGLPHDAVGEIVATAVVLERPVTERALRDHVRRHLTEEKVPEVVVVRDSLPRTETGKVLKRVLAAETAGRLRG
ncbi:MAG TPA: class I adenylate-forming enzyme family protein [Actinomycetota bacterium]|nr:class I adenylate-forming enzyme family protein [Actinomycetota bacterium]